ncbi:S8 family serine peptidase [Salipaludibacillus agaradhaerens]|uniref:S8 family serine peptidase n=1 Tax=Salipaludibacillus agaradhaerens TaxID=76935 RepID=A0A9Q4AZD3_SALAG|nr:S8 family serine peptidase [Salipaludibacillus agaradhaerens]MCR6095474.1 S8 family serine peptidase [Salipaludibacillus agaradhaerens]MCR6114966.1 S8 family serine peptidase [Salipaludibacillus agaradhaerens]
MKKSMVKKTVILACSFILLMSSFSLTSEATTEDFKSLTLIEGEYDFTSEELVTVMVQLEEPSLVEAKHTDEVQTQANLTATLNELTGEVTDLLPESDVIREYEYLFSGFALTLREKDVLQLLDIDGVAAVYPSITYEPDTFEPEIIPEESFSPEMMDSAPFIGAPEVWEEYGITGDGVTVAIIDTGVDYTHPDLEHAFGDYKGYDFVDNDDDPQEGAGQYHGTHVAGTVAANGQIKGVAPDASLLAYRTLGPQGGTTADVVAAIELAYKDGVDIMNLSLGNSINDPDFATSLALDWAMEEGVVAVTSNGNSGPDNWTVGSPATSREAISVGATQLPYNTFEANIFTSDNVTYPSVEVMGYANEEDLLALDNTTHTFVNAGLGYEEDFEDIDVQGHVAIIKRGEIPFVDKVENAADAGAVGAIIYNNVSGNLNLYIPGMEIPTLQMNQADGETLLNELREGHDTLTFNLTPDGEIGETIADFSSRGPTYGTWMIKPDVAAPGVAIVSTFPDEEYASLQGTSMSSPHVAGAAALLLEAKPDWNTTQVKAALMNTAAPIFDREGVRYPFNTQGAGSIRLVEALTTETLVTPGSHSFGVFDKEKGRQTERQHFEITNLSNERKRYNIDIEFYEGNEHIRVTTSKNLNVKPGGTQKVSMNVQVKPSALTRGYYEGMITLSHGDEKIEIPTILFVMDPDYPHLSYGSINNVHEGIIDFQLQLNRPVDYVETYLFTANLEPVTFLEEFGPLPQGEQHLKVDASSIYKELEPGDYSLVTFIGANEVEEVYVIGDFTVD